MFVSATRVRNQVSCSSLPDDPAVPSAAKVYGRFLQPDPLGYDDGMNAYAYVRADPINYVDPEGLTSEPNCDCDGDGQPDPEIIVTARKMKDKGWGFDFFIVNFDRVMHSIHLGVHNLAEALRPPEGRRSSESLQQCVRRVAGTAPGAAVAGGAGVAAGGGFLGYPRGAFGGGGNGTSLTSSAARASFGGQKMGGRIMGTASLGGAVGRGAATLSAAGGAALLGTGVGQLVGAAQICKK